MAQEAIFGDIKGKFVGIDLGTSNSVITYFENNKFEQVKFKNKKIIPSAIFFKSKDELIFGDIALRKGIVNPEFLLKEFKRDLGTQMKYTIEFDNSNNEKDTSNYVIDTNIFINEPLILDTFSKDNIIYLANSVISELSNHANKDDIKLNAQMALESIEKFKNEPNVIFSDSNLDILPEDFVANTPNDDNDNRILSIAKELKNNDIQVSLITNDNGLCIKSKNIDIECLKLDDLIKELSIKENKEIVTITPKDATRKLLEYLKYESEKDLSENITKTVITVPANFNPTQITLVKEAGEEAGFDEVAIQKEPVAVGFAYALDEKDDKTILVYDFGGGTFDASFLRVKNNNIEIIETDGDNKLGGKDITQKLIELIFEKIEDKYEIDMYDQKNSGLTKKNFNSNNISIWAEAEKVKIELSDYEKSDFEIANIFINNEEKINIELEITRKEFEQEIADIRKKSLDIVKNIINSSNIDISSIDEIVMAGGSSSIPSIRDSIKDTFDKDVRKSIDTSIVISQGAAIEAIRRWADIIDPKIKDKYIDNALKDFGIGIKDYHFDLLIPKGTSLPVMETREYTTQIDNQETISIKVFQRKSTYGNATKTYDDGIEFVDNIEINGIPPRKVGELTLKVSFELTKDDTLSLSVELLDINGDIKHQENLDIRKASHV